MPLRPTPTTLLLVHKLHGISSQGTVRYSTKKKGCPVFIICCHITGTLIQKITFFFRQHYTAYTMKSKQMQSFAKIYLYIFFSFPPQQEKTNKKKLKGKQKCRERHKFFFVQHQTICQWTVAC